MRPTTLLLLLASVLAFIPRGGAEPGNDPRFAAAAERSGQARGFAMLVMLDGRIVHEAYPNEGAPGRATELASGTKSFSGVLALCAVEDGLLTLDEKASETLTEWRDDPRRRDLTIRQILTLTSGIPGGESALRGGRVPSYAGAVEIAAVAEPGTTFSYGPNPFQVFGEILRRKLVANDETVASYLERRILEPLGIKPARWRSLAPGQPNLPSGAALTARDWARFGEAIRLDARGLLPPGRMAECFRGTAANPGYGLTWWLPGQGTVGAIARRTLHAPGMPKDIWMAAGAGGQRLVIVPSLKLVAVRLAPLRAEDGRPFNDAQWIRALVEPLTNAPSAEP
jgi:CubicO group peptidase (beta-lactamase class C family)